MKKNRVATDVGGTFTDLVYLDKNYDGSFSLRVVKSDTTFPSFEEGIFTALQKAGLKLTGLEEFIHGTTVVINTLTERKGVKTGLITTQGFRDILEIGRGNRPDFFNMSYKKPEPFVPRYLRREIPGRITYKGEEIEALDLSVLDKILLEFSAEKVEAIAICLLHSYANPAHEVAVMDYIAGKYSEFELIASSQITREWREYERTNTAVLSAYVKPTVASYVTKLSEQLKDKDFKGALYLMQSNGGMDTSKHIVESPLTLLESGPASGMFGAAELGKIIGELNCVGLDIGGTTAKCSLIINGHLQTKTSYKIENSDLTSGYPILLPVVDIVEIGNGGGSMVWVDKFNQMHVGPQSAGAKPGPVAYGNGGTELTTTDAMLALGYINPKKLCGGTRFANMPAVNDALQSLADKLGKESSLLARDIVRLANHSMLNALKLVSINRGKDPRDFALMPFGGGGGLHASFLALELMMKKVILPRQASVFSALGMLLSDVRRDFILTQLINLNHTTAQMNISENIRKLKEHARKSLLKHGYEDKTISFISYGQFRYQHQEHHVEIVIPENLDDEPTFLALCNQFHTAYQAEYTYQLDSSIELVGFRVVATIKTSKVLIPTVSRTNYSLSDALIESRKVDFIEFGTHDETPIFDGDRLNPGDRIDGPAIIERSDDACVLIPKTQALIDDYGNIVIDLSKFISTGIPRQILSDQMSLHIIQKIFEAASKEMFRTFARTAMSTIIYEVLDMGTGLTDKDGNLITSGAGVPTFSGLLDKTVKCIIKRHKVINPGDIFIVNSPYEGGVTHLNDVAIAAPIFLENEIVAWAANIAHWSDIGGMSPGSMTPEANNIYHEGMQIPPIKLFSKGEMNDAVITLLMANSRVPGVLKGDLLAAVASVRVGEARIKDCVKKYGRDTFFRSIEHYFDLGERSTLDGLSSLPKGTFSFQEEQDDREKYNVKIVITDKKFVVDIQDNRDQHPGPFNISRDAVVVVSQMVLKSITSPFTVCNAGTYRVLEVLTRKGSIFDPHYPAAMSIYYETLIRLHDLMLRALAVHIPTVLSAGGFSSICATLFGGVHPDTGREFTVIEPKLGGWGATHNSDGSSGLFSGIHGDTYQCPAEISEARDGVLVKYMSFHNQDGGEGQYRGGKGIRIDYFIRSEDAWLTAAFSRSRILPWGLEGGREGSENCIEIVRSTGQIERHAIVTSALLKKGDIIRVITGTGAGWGKPELRDEKAIEQDLKNGYITPQQAQKYYSYPRNQLIFWPVEPVNNIGSAPEDPAIILEKKLQ